MRVAVPVLVPLIVTNVVVVMMVGGRARPEDQHPVAVRPMVMMRVPPRTVLMLDRRVHSSSVRSRS